MTSANELILTRNVYEAERQLNICRVRLADTLQIINDIKTAASNLDNESTYSKDSIIQLIESCVLGTVQK